MHYDRDANIATVTSHAKATRELGYHPRPLYESIADAIHWFLESNQMNFSETRIN